MEPTQNALPPEELQPTASPAVDASTAEAPAVAETPAAAEATPAAEAPAVVGQALPPARVWTLVLIAGLIAGLASWLVGEAFHGQFDPALPQSNGLPTPNDARRDAQARRTGEILTATITYGSLGAILGLALGLAGGLARRSPRSTLTAALSGTILGAIAGAAMTQLLMPIYFRNFDPEGNDMVLAIMIQGGIFSAIGAVGGAALGIGLGGWGLALRTLLGGLLGAIAGVLLFQVVGALAFPLDETAKLISATWVTRLFCHLSVTLLAAICATTGWDPRKPRTA